jgi:LPS export ABC transporter protein LptC
MGRRRLLLAILALGFLTWFAAAGSEAQTGTGPSPAGSSPPDLVLRKIHLVETRGESVLWEVWADQVEMREAEGTGLLSRVTNPVIVILYSSQGQLRCTADRATVDLKTKDVRLDGTVVARSDQGTQLETDSVRWIAASRRLVSDRPVTISRGNLVTQGRGMDAETSLERVRIFQNITSSLQPGGAAPGTGRRGASP